MTPPKSRFPWRRASQWPVATCLGAALALVLFAIPGAGEAAQWQRGAGESPFWRLFTSHFVHFSGQHFLYDWLVFVGLGVVCERSWPARTRWTLAAAIVWIPIAVALGAPELSTYRGLSGLGSALWMLCVARLVRVAKYQGSWFALLPWIALVGFLIKVVLEFQSATTLFVNAEDLFVPVPIAHAVGGVLGFGMGIGPWSPRFLGKENREMMSPRWGAHEPREFR